MKIKSDYIYHIKDDFFKIANDKNLMQNHEYGKKRPTYYVIKKDKFLWFVPLSSKVIKYKNIIDKKIQKYGRCDTILIRKILGKESVILLQNAFPTLEKYIDHVHILENGKPARTVESVNTEILEKFNYMFKLKSKGVNLFFIDIDKIIKILEEELLKDILNKE